MAFRLDDAIGELYGIKIPSGNTRAGSSLAERTVTSQVNGLGECRWSVAVCSQRALPISATAGALFEHRPAGSAAGNGGRKHRKH